MPEKCAGVALAGAVPPLLGVGASAEGVAAGEDKGLCVACRGSLGVAVGVLQGEAVEVGVGGALKRVEGEAWEVRVPALAEVEALGRAVALRRVLAVWYAVDKDVALVTALAVALGDLEGRREAEAEGGALELPEPVKCAVAEAVALMGVAVP